MTVNVESPDTVYAPTGATAGPFATVWSFAAATDVRVIVETDGIEAPSLVLDIDFLMTASPREAGGYTASLVLQEAAIPAGGWQAGAAHRLILRRQTAPQQTQPYGQVDGFRPPVAEGSWDDGARMHQEHRAGLARALAVPVGEVPPLLETAARRANKVQAWGPDGLSRLVEISAGGLPIDGADRFLANVDPEVGRANLGAAGVDDVATLAQDVTLRNRPGVFNYSPTFMRRWTLALAGVRTGAASAKVAIIDDSTGAAYGAGGAGYTNGRAYSWPTSLKTLGDSAPTPWSADSFFGNANVGSSYALFDPRLAPGAGWDNSGGTSLGGFSWRNTTTTNPLVFGTGSGKAFDRISYMYVGFPGAGAFTVDIGGAAVATVNANLARGPYLATANCTSGAGAVNVKRVSGDVSLIGISLWSSTAARVLVHNMSWSGAQSGDYARKAFPEDAAYGLALLAPELSIIGLMINDWLNGVPPATYKANIQAIIGQLKPYGSVVLVTGVPTAVSLIPMATQMQYVAKLYELSLENDCPLIDFFARWTSYEIANNFNFYYDTIHPTAFGEWDMAQAVFDVIGRP